MVSITDCHKESDAFFGSDFTRKGPLELAEPLEQDRSFTKGDILLLCLKDPQTGGKSGEVRARIDWVEDCSPSNTVIIHAYLPHPHTNNKITDEIRIYHYLEGNLKDLVYIFYHPSEWNGDAP